jgi:hypothetical protein
MRLCSLFVCSAAAAPRFFATLSSPERHALASRHLVLPPEYSLYSAQNDTFVPGFAAIRGFNMQAPESDWIATLDAYTTAQGFEFANLVWPGATDALADNWPVLAALLAERGLAATDMGGFVPGGVQEYDARAAPNFTAGTRLLGNLYLGMDMGEQDVRYLWGYSANANLVGPTSRFESLVAFRDFCDAIEVRSALKLGALASSTYGVHHWLKTGFYTNAGAETSQTNGNAQVLYAFVRGAGKQFGVLWLGQVSIFNWFGHKIPGDLNPTADCLTQSDHSATCGTSLSLMKRLMYTQLAYDSAYFAFEGQLVLDSNASALSPIGALQLDARAFYRAAATPPSPTLGVHIPSIALLLDHASGFVRPCDARPRTFTAGAWGRVPWDAADALTDAVLDTMWPGYRAGALMHDESAYLSPTPFGDAADVLLSDVLPSVLALYDTVVLSGRIETDALDVSRRLEGFLMTGGTVVATASTLSDILGGVLAASAVSIGACSPAPAGTLIALASGGPPIAEPAPFVTCALLGPSTWVVLATSVKDGTPVAAKVSVGNGTLIVIGAGNYGMSTSRPADAPPLYACGVDEIDSRDAQPATLALFARHVLEGALAAAAAFDLGDTLAWVPKRESGGTYVLTITNPTLTPAPLNISSPLGKIQWVQVLPLGGAEKTAVGYLPHGFENATIGVTTNTTLAGGDTLIVRIALATDVSTLVPPPPTPVRAAALARRRLLRLAPGTAGDLRRAVLARPQFESTFAGFLVDYEYLASRTADALSAEAAWLAPRGVHIAVDFSRATNLFPGLRLSDDLHGAFEESLAVLTDVLLVKMPAARAADALLTLHNPAEIPPANFSSGVPAYAASITSTLRALSAAAAPLNITLHLRRSARNTKIAGGSLGEQASFAAAAGVRLAPALAYATIAGDAAADAAALFTKGAASFFMLSAAWTGATSIEEGAPAAPALAPGPTADWLQTVHGAAEAASAWVVVDAAWDASAAGRAGELADVRAIEDVVGAYAV